MLSALVAYVQDHVPKLVKDPKEREAVLRPGPAGGEQPVHFGSRGEDLSPLCDARNNRCTLVSLLHVLKTGVGTK